MRGSELGSYETQFEQAVCEAFAGVCAAYGLSARRRGQLDIIFENDRVTLVVAQRHAWDQVAVEIGQRAQDKRYDLDVIAAWKGETPIALQIGDEEVLRRLLPRAADFLCQNADALLRGNTEAFAALASFAHARDLAYTKRFTVDPILRRAHEAWDAHDYGLVVDLLSSVKADLSDNDRQRMRLAAKYLEHEHD